MINSFNLPVSYLALFGIPFILVLLALTLRQWVFEQGGKREQKIDKKKELTQNLYWVIPAILLGLVAWYILRPLVEGREITVYFYGVLITLGVIAAAFLGSSEAKRRGFNQEYMWDALFWVVLAGIVGARLWYVIAPPKDLMVQGINLQYYLSHPLDAINIRSGGLGIPGAVIGGALALWIYCRRKKISFLDWADIIAPGVALGQAIGRWGNFFNQELYGPPTDLPWKIYIDPMHRDQAYKNYDYFHPLFFYEMLWNLLNMAILLIVSRRYQKWLKSGDIFYFYASFYAIGRFALEFLRVNQTVVGGINFNQVAMVFVVLLAGSLVFWNHRPHRIKKKVIGKRCN
jgi:phosphatidylglycerol:prolipoprotein diacylglycerol transferase